MTCAECDHEIEATDPVYHGECVDGMNMWRDDKIEELEASLSAAQLKLAEAERRVTELATMHDLLQQNREALVVRLSAAKANDPGAVGTPPDGEPGVIESATTVLVLLEEGTQPLRTLGLLRAALLRCGVKLPRRALASSPGGKGDGE